MIRRLGEGLNHAVLNPEYLLLVFDQAHIGVGCSTSLRRIQGKVDYRSHIAPPGLLGCFTTCGTWRIILRRAEPRNLECGIKEVI
jgi:hypothetical protein